MFQGYALEGIELGQRALEVAFASEDDEALRVHPELFQGFALVNADRLEEGERLLIEGRERGRKLGTVWDIPLYRWYKSIKHFHAGEWDDAVLELEAGIAVADEIETNWELLNLYGTLANITLHRGDFRRTETLLREIEQRTHPSRAPVALIWFAWTRALLAEANGDAPTGYRLLADQWDQIREREVVVAARRLGPDLVRLALEAGDEEHARSVTKVAELGAERAAFPSSIATAAHCRGSLERDRALLLKAAAEYERGPRPLSRALALEEAGALSKESGDTDSAISSLQTAAAIYESLAAAYDLARAESHLRDLGIRRARPRRGARPQTGWDSLTETERKVVAHVAEGLTNPEIARRMFVSPRTVSTHLKHIFKKLGITSRVELATQATRRDTA
jgi:DNA-binding CsgD family transcriptional regulator